MSHETDYLLYIYLYYACHTKLLEVSLLFYNDHCISWLHISLGFWSWLYIGKIWILLNIWCKRIRVPCKTAYVVYCAKAVPLWKDLIVSRFVTIEHGLKSKTILHVFFPTREPLFGSARDIHICHVLAKQRSTLTLRHLFRAQGIAWTMFFFFFVSASPCRRVSCTRGRSSRAHTLSCAPRARRKHVTPHSINRKRLNGSKWKRARTKNRNGRLASVSKYVHKSWKMLITRKHAAND